MRSSHSHPLFLAASVIATLGLAACVQPAETDSTDTIAPLVLPGVTTSTVPTTAVGSGSAATVLIDAGAMQTLPTSITVPEETVTTPPETDPPASSTTVVVVGKQAYTVVDGDTVYRIARRCSISATELATYNGWTSEKHAIFPGNIVQLPCDAPAGSASSTSTTTATTSPGGTSVSTTTITPGAGGTYTIVSGDYLAGIAAKTGTTVAAIVAENGWPDGDKHLIIAGQKIKLPAKK
jgi:LysM repeat protein